MPWAVADHSLPLAVAFLGGAGLLRGAAARSAMQAGNRQKLSGPNSGADGTTVGKFGH